jgi:phage shock protein E
LKSKSVIYIISTFLLVGILSGCSNTNGIVKENQPAAKKATFTNITPEEAKKRMDSEKGIVLLDVRSEDK